MPFTRAVPIAGTVRVMVGVGGHGEAWGFLAGALFWDKPSSAKSASTRLCEPEPRHLPVAGRALEWVSQSPNSRSAHAEQ